MSCSLRVDITKDKDLVDSFYADLHIRDMIQFDRDLFGWVSDNIYENKDEDKYYSEIVTDVSNIRATVDKYESIFMKSIDSINDLKIQRLNSRNKVVFEELTGCIATAEFDMCNNLNDLKSLVGFHSSIELLCDKHNIYDYSLIKIHMYLG